MSLPLSTARAAKTMPKGKGYGSKAGAKKKENPFAKKAAAGKKANPFAKKAAAGKEAAGKGAAKKMPAFLKRKKK